jgi:hypothetical protein
MVKVIGGRSVCTFCEEICVEHKYEKIEMCVLKPPKKTQHKYHRPHHTHIPGIWERDVCLSDFKIQTPFAWSR